MPYATVIDVANRGAFRGTYTATSIPSASQVISYLQDSESQLNQWLLAGGYDAPFDVAITSGKVASAGVGLLRSWTTTGAALLVEQAAQQSDREPIYQKMWDQICKMCMDQSIDVPLPMLIGKAHPRGFGQGAGTAVAPGFTFDVTPGIPGSGNYRGSWDL